MGVFTWPDLQFTLGLFPSLASWEAGREEVCERKTELKFHLIGCMIFFFFS